jgi:hypothetical protein
MKPAFEVIRADGHAFRIWADGRTEGFGEGSAIVINRIPGLIAPGGGTTRTVTPSAFDLDARRGRRRNFLDGC